MKLLDSWAQIPVGILFGHTHALGHFEQCLKYNYTINDLSNDYNSFNGQYCKNVIPYKFIKELNIGLELFENVKEKDLQLGLCWPDTCSTEIINDNWKSLLKSVANVTSNKSINFDDQNLVFYCQTNAPTQFTIMDYIGIGFFGLVGLLMVLSSIYDCIMQLKQQEQNDILAAFSVITNIRKLFKISTKKSPEKIKCLNGLSCLSMIWIVLGHSYTIYSAVNFLNDVQWRVWLKSFFSVFIQFGTVSVDTFLFISGLSIIWHSFRELSERGGDLDSITWCIRRYLRITPALIATILFCLSIIKHIGSGPFWMENINPLVEVCQENWWASILFIQNYISTGPIDKTVCVPQSWYLAVDTQLFIVSPIMIKPLWKWGTKMSFPIVILVIASNLSVFITQLSKDETVVISTDPNSALDQMRTVYTPTHARCAPWLIGILAGYMLFKNKDKRPKLSKYTIALGWLISIGTMLTIVMAPFNTARKDAKDATKLEKAIYQALSRSPWAISLGWIVFACHNGYGGIINSFLSWPIWEPFARLNYGIYLVHYILQFMVNANIKSDKYFSDFDVIYKFWGDMGFTISISILLILGFESPVIRIEKYFRNRSNKKNEELVNVQPIAIEEILDNIQEIQEQNDNMKF